MQEWMRDIKQLCHTQITAVSASHSLVKLFVRRIIVHLQGRDEEAPDNDAHKRFGICL